MHLKIYFNNKPLFLTNEIDAEIEPYVHHDDAVFVDELSSPGINSMIHEMRLEKVHAGIYYDADLEKLKKAFFKKFLLVTAAGGLVVNDENKLLLMKRRGKWDLPKGKLDEGESLEECALREVTEETGLQDIRLDHPLLITYHTYDENGKHILKDTHWYKMTAPAKQSLTPQSEEDITSIEWLSKKEIQTVTQNTFPSIIDVLQAGGYL